MRLVRTKAAGPSIEGVARAALPLDAEELARLESLGYTGGVDPAPGDGRLDPKDMMPVVERIDRAKGLAAAGRFDESLAESGWMAAEHLITLDEVSAALPGFEFEQAEVRVTEHSHGTEAHDLPVVIVVARHPGPLTQGV